MIVNNFSFCISALQRSGHHAIINWLITNKKNNGVFLNNCQPQTNPYLSSNKTDSLPKNYNWDPESRGDFTKKEFVIWNYEDKSLNSIYSETTEKNITKWIGLSKTTMNIIVLRDPFNNLASKYKWLKEGEKWQPSMSHFLQLPELWKSYAREFVGQTNRIKKNKIGINYNQWFQDESYKKELSKKLELDSYNNGIKEVAKWGPNTWGDSFDNLNYEGKADEMKVLERWKIYKDDEFYIQLFRDKELLNLSKEIFGILPGTEFLY